MTRRMIPVYALLILAACAERIEEEPGIDSGTDAAIAEDAGASEPDAAPADSGPSTEDDASTSEPDASTSEPDASTSEPDASTSEPDGGVSEPDAGADAAMPDAGACSIGIPCNPSKGCAGDDRCYGHEGNGFCAPWAPECGGFVKTRCAPGLTCIRAGGSSLGYCADSHEQYCICRSADVNGFTTDGCV